MANFTVEMYSDCLKRQITLKMVVPADYRSDTPVSDEDRRYRERPMKTLFLLHGYTGKGDSWVPEELAEKYHFAIVCPNGENGFWLNGRSEGHAYQSLVGEELVEFVRATFGLAKNREDTYIMGLSMGGFGALHTALSYPEVFSKTVALSSALIEKEVSRMQPGSHNGVANYEYYLECFGEPEKVMESENAPEYLVKKLLREGREFPEIHMACGTEDFLLSENREMDAFLTENGVCHTYLEWPGSHDMKFWQEAVWRFIPEIMAENEA